MQTDRESSITIGLCNTFDPHFADRYKIAGKIHAVNSDQRFVEVSLKRKKHPFVVTRKGMLWNNGDDTWWSNPWAAIVHYVGRHMKKEKSRPQ